MVVATAEKIKISPDEYLEAEKTSLFKHEYIQGEVYEIVGSSDPHVTISLNLASLLRSFLRGKGCRVYISDIKVRIDSLNIFYYPDVLVTCDPRDQEFSYYKKYPKLIVEVLSESTEAKDRGNKFADYRQLETLQEYVLVSQTKMLVECFRRNSDNLWVLYPYTNPQELVTFSSVDFTFSLADLYEDVYFES
jgi:Uma2 family endonuclease